jgi:Flp pilus assembly protein TadB
MMNDYERETFDDLVRRLDADDPEFVASFRARKSPSIRGQQSESSGFHVAVTIVSALLAVLLVVLAQPASALPAVALAVCAWYLRKSQADQHNG